MFCQKCGQEISDNAVMCPNCQTSSSPAVGKTAPKSYLAQAIIVTILCCWPLGIPAIVYAAQVNSKFASGDIEGAAESSKKANMWSWIAFAAGLIVVGGYAAIMALGAIASQN